MIKNYTNIIPLLWHFYVMHVFFVVCAIAGVYVPYSRYIVGLACSSQAEHMKGQQKKNIRDDDEVTLFDVDFYEIKSS